LKILSLLAIILCSINTCLWGQKILNGSFEANIANIDRINLNNTSYDSFMYNSRSFGTFPNIDIITSDKYCGFKAAEGKWYVALTGGGSDALSLKLDSNLVAGYTYTLSFYDKYCIFDPIFHYQPTYVEIGTSLIDTAFGKGIYITNTYPSDYWIERVFDFVASDTAKYITVKLNNYNNSSTWIQLDAFKIKLKSIGTNINNINKEEVLFYPNPAKDYIYLTNPEKIKSIKIYNMLGMLLQSHDNNNGQLIPHSIDLNNLQAGIYLVYCTSKTNAVYTKRLVIATL
jgi:hypothetical protein